jgi:hypothetical protein
MLLLFRLVRSTRPSPAAYNERRNEILERLYDWEMAARLSFGPTSDNTEPHVHVEPALDSEFTNLHPEQWLLAADRRLRSFEAAASENGTSQWGNWGRFYTAEAVQAASKALEPPATRNSAADIEEVPWDDSEPPF